MTNTPRRFDENPNTTTNLQKDSTEYFGISQSGASKVIKTSDAFTKANVGLNEVDNTSDANKPVSVAQQTALDLKADESDVTTALNLKADKSDTYTKSEVNALNDAQDVNIVLNNNKINDALAYTEALHSESIKADKELQSQVTVTRKVASQASVETYNGEDIVNDNEVSIVGKADDGIIDVANVVVDGELDIKLKGKTYNNLIENGGIDRTFPTGGTITTDIADYSSNLLPIGNYVLMYNIVSTGTVNTRNTPKITFDDDSLLYEYTLNNYNIITGRKAWLFTTTKKIKELEWWGDTLDVPTVANNFILVNLDQLGLVTTITTPQQALDYFNFVDGTANTLPKKITVTSKNLFDKNKVLLGSISSNDGGTFVPTTDESKLSTNLIKVKSGENYIISGNNRSNWLLYDKDKNIISYIGTTSTVLIPNDCMYVQVYFGYEDSSLKDTFQLELGTVVTSYEPYSETVAKVPVELRSLPNGVRDTFDVTSGIYNNNVGKYILTEDDIVSYNTTSYSNFDFISIDKPNDYLGYNRYNSNLGDLVLDTHPNIYYFPDLNDVRWVNKIRTDTNNTSVWLMLAKGTYATLQDAKTALAGTVVYYQLVTPIVTQYEPQPLLSSKGSQIQVESFESKVVSNSNGVITFDYDIESVEHVYRYDTGIEVETTDYTFTNNVLTVNNVTGLIVISADVYLKNSTTATIVSQVAVDNLVSRIAKLEALVATLI